MVFGFYGVYKRLATHLDIVDGDLALGKNMHRLLKVWQREQELIGFSDHERIDGDGPRLRKALREAVREALPSGQTEHQGGWTGGSFFSTIALHTALVEPKRTSSWSLLVDGSAAPRGEFVCGQQPQD